MRVREVDVIETMSGFGTEWSCQGRESCRRWDDTVGAPEDSRPGQEPLVLQERRGWCEEPLVEPSWEWAESDQEKEKTDWAEPATVARPSSDAWMAGFLSRLALHLMHL